MKATMLILMSCLLLGASNLSIAAATAATAAAAKAAEAEAAANASADAAKAEADTAEEEEAKTAAAAAKAAAKAAEAAKAAAAAKIAKAKAAVAKAQEKTEAAKAAIAAAAKRGARSCDEWKLERAGKVNNGPVVTWFNGFLAGIAVAKNQDFLIKTKDQALYASVDEYCDSHPFEFVSDAGIYLYLELARKKGLIE